MNQIIFDTDITAKAVRRIAADYPTCVYRDTSLPCKYGSGGANNRGCLIGQAIRITNDDFFKKLLSLEEETESGIKYMVELCSDSIIVTSTKLNWLQLVQNFQDLLGVSWREAIERADYLERMFG